MNMDLHPPWAAFTAYSLVAVLCAAAGWYWRGWREAQLRQRDAALALSHEVARHAKVLDAASDAVITIDDAHRVVVFNAAAQRMFGCRADEVLGTDIERFIPPEARARHRTLIREFADSGTPQRAMNLQRRVFALHADGTRFPVEAWLSQSNLPGAQGQTRLYTVLMRDVSEQRRAEEALRESEARYRAIFEHAVVGIAQMDLDGRFLGANGRFCDMLDYTVDELLGLRMQDLTHPDDLHDNLPQFSALAHGGPAFTLEKRCRRRDGSVIWVESAFNAMRTPAGTVHAIVTTSINIDSRKLATQALQRSHAELRRLTASLTHAREEERRHIARELHDELGQCLSAIKMELSSLSVTKPNDPPLEQRLGRLLETVDDTIVSARRIAADLRPAMLDDLGLSAALEWLVRNWSSRSGVDVALLADPVDEVINEAAATAIYRIAQEALTNVGRHARATQADVRLRFDETDLVLCVEDDGDGLAPGDIDKDGSHGLLGIRERVHVLGGTAFVDNAPEGGCRLEVRLPLARIDLRQGRMPDAVA